MLRAEEQELQKRTQGKRYFQLDALRGLGALCVVLHHLRYAFHDQDPRWYLKPLFAGHSAVILFFVLSGYVLSLPFWNKGPQPYWPYLIRRFCRIYLPFFFAAWISIAGDRWLGRSHLPLSNWYYGIWQQRVSWIGIRNQLLMWPVGDFNTAFWSLRYEMQLSIAMPLLLLIMRRWGALGVTLVSAFAVYANPRLMTHLSWHFFDQTTAIGVFFLLGACLARYGQELRGWFEPIGRWNWLVLSVSLFLFYGYFLYVLPQWHFGFFYVRQDLALGIGAGGILLCSLYLKPFADALQHPVMEYLGRISYSLYLVHSVVIYAGLNLLYGQIPLPVLLPLLVVSSVGLAEIFYRLVEAPSMKLGKRLSDKARPALPSALPQAE